MALMQMNKISVDEDDDDLESLRLAALQSFQKKAPPFELGPYRPKEHVHKNIYSPNHRRGRGGYHQNNRGRSGMFTNHNPRSQNPNLISIPMEVESPAITTVPPLPKGKPSFTADKDTFKLTLPQDRYRNKPVEKNAKVDVSSSKFSRYDNSDDSESESEEEPESEGSDSESTGLHKAGSLEALMEELENEIKGKSSACKTESADTKTPKVKRRNKRLRTRTEVSAAENDMVEASLDTEPINSPEHHDVPVPVADLLPKDEAQANIAQVALKPAEEKLKTRDSRKPSPPRTMMRNRSPPPRKLPNTPPYRQNTRDHSPMRPPRPNHNNFNSNNTFHTFPPQQQFAPPFVGQPPYGNNAPFPLFTLDLIRQQPPPFLPRPFSPLAINTEALCSITKAPLSPRSAAFVLQNREIVAQRRRKSPKRTFSRSPSPRRSPSPLTRRSLSKSPVRNRGRSRSPLPPLRRLSPTSRGGRNNSPPRRRRSVSPGNIRRNNNRKPLKERRSPPPATKPSVRDRLGVRGKETVNRVVETTSQTENKTVAAEEAIPVLEDSIFEARKRKFERTEINVKDGGVIKLKKEEDQPQQQEQPIISNEKASKMSLTDLVEEALLLEHDLLSDIKGNDIFSDEQSDEDNEGRFKASTIKSETSGSKSFNGTIDIKAEPLITEQSRKRTDKPDRKRRRRSRSKEGEAAELEKTPAGKHPQLKQCLSRIGKQTKMAVPARVTSPIENKKIEIKIRNPAKYEEQTSRSKYDVATEDEMRRTDEMKQQRGKKDRQVDVVVTTGMDIEELVEEEVDVEGQVAKDAENDGELEREDDNGIADNKCADGGDLRAQLSRKRAERQNKLPVAKVIHSRLVQNALNEAVFKKVKKSKKSKHRDSALKDGKLPIHLRLGSGDSEVEIYTEHKKKSKKSKHRSQDQV